VEIADEIFSNVLTEITYHKAHLFRGNIKNEDSLTDRGEPEFIKWCTKTGLKGQTNVDGGEIERCSTEGDHHRKTLGSGCRTYRGGEDVPNLVCKRSARVEI
jgi:hypothetical protein